MAYDGTHRWDPDLYLRAAELLGVTPARCLAIEDSPSGVAAAERAGEEALRDLAEDPEPRSATPDNPE